jgi:hypothetical protein
VGFSIGSLGRDKSDLLKGEGWVNCLLSRGYRRLFAMRLSRHDGPADESGPFPHMLPDTLDDPVLDSSISHIGRTRGGFRSGLKFEIWTTGFSLLSVDQTQHSSPLHPVKGAHDVIVVEHGQQALHGSRRVASDGHLYNLTLYTIHILIPDLLSGLGHAVQITSRMSACSRRSA